MNTEYEFDDPSKWAKDPAGRSLHALHMETGDVVSLDETTYKALFPTRKKKATATASEPAVSEPAVSEPAVSEPAVSEPATSEEETEGEADPLAGAEESITA